MPTATSVRGSARGDSESGGAAGGARSDLASAVANVGGSDGAEGTAKEEAPATAAIGASQPDGNFSQLESTVNDLSSDPTLTM